MVGLHCKGLPYCCCCTSSPVIPGSLCTCAVSCQGPCPGCALQQQGLQCMGKARQHHKWTISRLQWLSQQTQCTHLRLQGYLLRRCAEHCCVWHTHVRFGYTATLHGINPCLQSPPDTRMMCCPPRLKRQMPPYLFAHSSAWMW